MLPPRDWEKTQIAVTCRMAQNKKNNGKGIIADHDRTEEEEIAQKSRRRQNIRSLARPKTIETRTD